MKSPHKAKNVTCETVRQSYVGVGLSENLVKWKTWKVAQPACNVHHEIKGGIKGDLNWARILSVGKHVSKSSCVQTARAREQGRGLRVA